MIEPLDAPTVDVPRPRSTTVNGARIGTPPAPTLAACVVIPARDEADSIEQTLAALAAQRDLSGQPLNPRTYEIVLLANNCRDDTAAVARRQTRRDGPPLHIIELDLPPEHAHVGYARRLAMNEACRRLLAVGRPRGVIATTDADTIVSPTWLAETLREVTLGAEAVGGRVLVSAQERQALAPPVRSRFLRNVGYWALASEVMARVDPRPGDPWPCHEQFSGASIAVTARAYRRVGGLPPLASSEDAALAEALERADIEIRHSPAVHISTSARLIGRATGGMADLLASWSTRGAAEPFPKMPSASTVVSRATGRRALRDLWRQAQQTREVCAAETAHLADFAGVSEAWLHRAICSAERFGPLLHEVGQLARWQTSPALVDVRDAIDELRQWLEPYRRPGAPPPIFSRHLAGLPYASPTTRAALHSVPEPAEAASAPLEEIQPVAALTAPLTSPPHVA